MGNIYWNEDGWYIDKIDRISIGEEIEIYQADQSWKKVIVAQDHNGIFHIGPVGEPLKKNMTVRRPQQNQ